MTETLPIDGRTVLTLAPAATPIDGAERAFGSDAPFEEWNVLLVAYGHDHDRLRTAWCDRFGRMPADFGSISVGAGVHPRTAPRPESRRDVTVTVRDPTNLAELGITISLYLDDWTSRRTLVCFHSIEDLITHAGDEAAFRFVHLLTGRLASADAIGQFSLDPSALEESTVRTLETTFDVVREADSDADPSSLPPDTAFDVLRASRRRYVLHYLRRGGGPVTAEELAERVAGHDPDGRERIEASLRHTHLPKLEAAGLIARPGGRVTARPAIASLAPYLELVSERDFPD